MGHNHSPQDEAYLDEAMDEDNDDIYLADADSEGSTVKMDFDTSSVEINGPPTFSVNSVDATVDRDGDGFFIGNEARTGLYADNGFLLSRDAHRRSRYPPSFRTAEEHSPPNIPRIRSLLPQRNSTASDVSNYASTNLSSVLSNGLSIDLAQADDLADRLSNAEFSQPIDQLGEQLNDLSIHHSNENDPDNDSQTPPSHIASDQGLDEYGMELIRWFKPSQIQGIPLNRLLVYNTRKQISHVRKLKPPNFPFLSEGDTWIDEGTIVISIAAQDRAENNMPVAWGVHFGPGSRFNMWRPVRSMLPQNKKSACIYAMQNTLGFIHSRIFLVDPDIHTIIIRNSSPWLTRAMTGGLELYNFGCHLPWLEGHQLLYLQDLKVLVSMMQSMTEHGTNPLKFRFWCVEPEANRDAIELARRVYSGSRSTQN